MNLLEYEGLVKGSTPTWLVDVHGLDFIPGLPHFANISRSYPNMDLPCYMIAKSNDTSKTELVRGRDPSIQNDGSTC